MQTKFSHTPAYIHQRARNNYCHSIKSMLLYNLPPRLRIINKDASWARGNSTPRPIVAVIYVDKFASELSMQIYVAL